MKQKLAFQSHISHVVDPLQQRGHVVHIILALDRIAGLKANMSTAHCERTLQHNSSEELLGLHASFAGLQFATGAHIHFRQPVFARSQAEGIRAALSMFLQNASGLQYDFLMLSRYDLLLKSPIDSWGCDWNKVNFANKCEPRAWSSWNCTNDMFFIVPQRYLLSFGRSIGARKRPSRYKHCCFNDACFRYAVGHGCGNMVASALGGFENVSFCWPQPVRTVTDPNNHYSLPLCSEMPRNISSVHTNRCKTGHG